MSICHDICKNKFESYKVSSYSSKLVSERPEEFRKCTICERFIKYSDSWRCPCCKWCLSRRKNKTKSNPNVKRIE
jgi:uncharacterized paraquat-inducible protein A